MKQYLGFLCTVGLAVIVYVRLELFISFVSLIFQLQSMLMVNYFIIETKNKTTKYIPFMLLSTMIFSKNTYIIFYLFIYLHLSHFCIYWRLILNIGIHVYTLYTYDLLIAAVSDNWWSVILFYSVTFFQW